MEDLKINSPIFVNVLSFVDVQQKHFLRGTFRDRLQILPQILSELINSNHLEIINN